MIRHSKLHRNCPWDSLSVFPFDDIDNPNRKQKSSIHSPKHSIGDKNHENNTNIYVSNFCLHYGRLFMFQSIVYVATIVWVAIAYCLCYVAIEANCVSWVLHWLIFSLLLLFLSKIVYFICPFLTFISLFIVSSICDQLWNSSIVRLFTGKITFSVLYTVLNWRAQFQFHSKE